MPEPKLEIRKAMKRFRCKPKSYIGIRTSEAEKTEMQTIARSLGVNLTQYILGLHRIAVGKEATDAS